MSPDYQVVTSQHADERTLFRTTTFGASLTADWRNASGPTPSSRYSLITGHLALPALLAVILLLALVRLFRERLPLITVGFILILIWWAALGLSDPDWVIMSWNAKLGV